MGRRKVEMGKCWVIVGLLWVAVCEWDLEAEFRWRDGAVAEVWCGVMGCEGMRVPLGCVLGVEREGERQGEVEWWRGRKDHRPQGQ
jgi:hypothetical protein